MKKMLILFFIFVIFSNESYAEKYDPIGYWSYEDCDYALNMNYFGSNGYLKVTVKEKPVFKEAREDKYIYNPKMKVVKSGRSAWKFLDQNTLSRISKGYSEHKEMIRCDIEKSRILHEQQVAAIKDVKEAYLCSGHDLTHKCLFEIRHGQETIRAILKEKCFLGEDDPSSKLREKGFVHEFDSAEVLSSYIIHLCE